MGFPARAPSRASDRITDVPSACADRLARGEVDAGLVPSIEAARIPGVRIVRGVGIASKERVRSVILASRRPAREPRRRSRSTSSSRSSAAMARVLFRTSSGRAPEFHTAAPDLGEMLAHHDAALLLGDPALKADLTGLHVLDLAEGWRRLTGLPFVFAVWAVRPVRRRRSRSCGRASTRRRTSAEIVAAAVAAHGARRRRRSASTSTGTSTTTSRPRTRRASPSSTAARTRTACSPRRTRRPSWACRSSRDGRLSVRALLDGSGRPPERARAGARRLPRASREVLARARGGERLSWDDGLALFREATLLEAGGAADAVRRRQAPRRTASRTRSTGTSTTRTSASTAARSARSTGPRATPRATSSPFEEIGRKVEETIALGGTGILLQGGVHAELPFSFYEELLSFLREKYPRVHRHAFSAPEIHFLAKKEKTTVADVLAAPPEGRAAVASRAAAPRSSRTSVRKRIWALTKAPTEKWAEVHRAAHRLGMPTTATMMFGVGETHEERLHHLDVVRRVQDASLAEGVESFTAFIPWTFQEENTALDGTVETAGGTTTCARSRSRGSTSTTCRTCRARGSRRARRSAASRRRSARTTSARS